MRKSFKKIAAVALAAAMTMATSVMAFADQTITFHFQNAKNWENVGGHIYQGVGFTTNKTPIDKCFVVSTNDDGTPKPIWPGAKMEKEADGWYKISATFTDTVADEGFALIFNNGVGDIEPNDVGFSQADADAVKASGIPNTSNATKEQTGNITLGKKAIAKAGGIKADYYVTYDGKDAVLLDAAPESYTSAIASATPSTDTGAAGSTDAGTAGTAGSTGTAGTAGSGTSSSTKAPTTGDTVAVTVVMFGLVAAVAFVASKKKVNA